MDQIFFQDFVYLSEKTLDLSLLTIVESELISNKYKFDREQEPPVDIWFIYSPDVLLQPFWTTLVQTDPSPLFIRLTCTMH